MESRNTIQRSLVFDAVHAMYHPTADEIYDFIAADHPTVSRGTVYRNLNVLVEQGRLRKVPVPDGADRFDHTLADHYHVRCRICGKVDDVDFPFQEELHRRTGSSRGYRMESHEILFRGVCPQCGEKQA